MTTFGSLPLRTLGLLLLAVPPVHAGWQAPTTTTVPSGTQPPAREAPTEGLVPADGQSLPPLVGGQTPPPDVEVPRDGGGEPPSLTLGTRRIFFGLDFSFASIWDGAQAGSMGRERQMKPAFIVLSAFGDLTDRLSYRVEINPVDDSMVPRPYTPGDNDRRTYFFPNQPDVVGGRGVVSDPAGLYMVDTYKHPGFDPYIPHGLLRAGHIDVHVPSRRFGVSFGRLYVPQGLPLSTLTWFSSKDLNKIQLVNAQIDNGVIVHAERPRIRIEAGIISGNGSPFHDYGYYDYTTAHEDRNSAIGGVARVTLRPRKGLQAGVSVKHNYLNSRIEDSITLQLSKKYDSAFIGFFHYRALAHLAVYGEVARYKWGMRDSSADLVAGPRPSTPLWKDGYYVGVEATTPQTRIGRYGLTVTRGEISRDDSLVSWAEANDLFGVRLGKRERSTVLKVTARFSDHLQAFGFLHLLSNPFPELSAITPIAGPQAGREVNNNKHGWGLRVLF